MNKYLSGFAALCVFPVVAFAEGRVATESSSNTIVREYKTEKAPIVVYRQKDTPVNIVISKYKGDASRDFRVDGGYGEQNNVRVPLTVNDGYSVADKEQRKDVSKYIRDGKFYIGLNGDISFLSWKNEYSSAVKSGTDRFTLKPVLGADAVIGYNFNKNWRVDAEVGYVGKYTEKETETFGVNTTKTEFSLQTYYTDLNAYCDIAYGFYAGVGGGLAIVNLSADNSEVQSSSVTNVSPMGTLTFGWAYALDEKVDFDIRYRFAVFNGGSLNIGDVKVDSGIVMNNSLSLGVKYYF